MLHIGIYELIDDHVNHKDEQHGKEECSNVVTEFLLFNVLVSQYSEVLDDHLC